MRLREIGRLTGPKPKEIEVETFSINYLARSPEVEKLGFGPVSRLSPDPKFQPPHSPNGLCHSGDPVRHAAHTQSEDVFRLTT